MTLAALLVLVALAVIGNILMRAYLRNDPETFSDEPAFPDPNMSTRSGEELLAAWGLANPLAESAIHSHNLPDDLADVFARHSVVVHPIGCELLDRRLLSTERFGDQDFVPIGNWFDGARLFSRGATDSSVYYFNDEYSTEPIPMCRSISDLLRMADVAGRDPIYTDSTASK